MSQGGDLPFTWVLAAHAHGLAPLRQIAPFLQDKYALEAIIEPGASVVRDACSLIAQVIDLFESDGIQITVLDTTVNYMPEVFEYQFSPNVVGHTESGSAGANRHWRGYRGHAGDATPVSRLLASICDNLITHPNSDINEMTESTLDAEGNVICRLLMGTIELQKVRSSRVLAVLKLSHVGSPPAKLGVYLDE